MVEYCGRCKRRRILRYRVREDIQRLVLLNRWKSAVCAACFDELAEKGGIALQLRGHRGDEPERCAAVAARAQATVIAGSSRFGSTAAPVPARHGLRERPYHQTTRAS